MRNVRDVKGRYITIVYILSPIIILKSDVLIVYAISFYFMHFFIVQLHRIVPKNVSLVNYFQKDPLSNIFWVKLQFFYLLHNHANFWRVQFGVVKGSWVILINFFNNGEIRSTTK